MKTRIKVVILDDHQGIIDGYIYRLSSARNIEVVATITYGDELEPALEAHLPDVLVLDVQVPINADNPNPFPVLNILPKILKKYPDMSILVITMHAQPTLVKTILDAGVSGYILKDDRVSIQALALVITMIVEGGIHLSQDVYKILMQPQTPDYSNNLNPRQLEALTLCSAYPDESTAQLATRMDIEGSTLRNLLSGAYIKLGVRTRAAAIAKAHQMGLISINSLDLQKLDNEMG
jgi:DNA-binding NarL/FixJ family response regulator